MKRMIFLTCILAIICCIVPMSAKALDYAPGFDGYTYFYRVYIDSQYIPRIKFMTFSAKQYDKTEIATLVETNFKGSTKQTFGNSDIYSLSTIKTTAVVCYNSEGRSTSILLMSDDMKIPPGEQL